MLRGYIIQDWQDYNIAIFGCEATSTDGEGKIVKSRSRRSGKPVHYPCVYYRAQWESDRSFKERIILEHPSLTLEQFKGL